MYDVLSQNIQYLHGVGPRRAQLLNEELGIYTLHDLLYHFPYRYIDRSRIYTVHDLSDGMQYVQLKGRILGYETLGKGSARRIEADFTDGTGYVRLVWFKGLKYVERTLKTGVTYLLLGKPTLFNNRFNIAHPELDVLKDDSSLDGITGLRPVYRVTEKMKRSGLTSGAIEEMVDAVFSQLKGLSIAETLPDYLLSRCHLMGLNDAIRKIHHPESLSVIPSVELRLKFEELFYVQLDVLSYAKDRVIKYRGFRFSRVGDYFMRFYHECLPFELTSAQKRVIREIRHDLGSGRQMNRLLQGDVGSGKTMVSVMTMLIGIDNDYQSCIMAPTEILAEQHCATMQRLLGPIGVRVELLTGTVKGKRRQSVLDGLQDGSIHVLVGTHALLEDTVNFKNLGVAVIDEQHRFGVEQRSRLWLKNEFPPHILVMTATPIPRTLAMTVYGDLDVSVIDELPPGRKQIKTAHFYDKAVEQRVQLVRSEVAKGHQVYFVYPLIKESEKSDLKNLEEGFRQICKQFPDLNVGMLHGKMKPSEKNDVMQSFASGELHLLVSTTVIEVGVDVPNASVMIIENAERFGLAQLHQLRGRVGRGAEQSYCVLVTGYKLSENTRRRVEIMCETTDGFRIAEEDLKLRGPGDLEGTQQSGVIFTFKIANIARDGELLQQAREVARQVVDEDPMHELPQNKILWSQLKLQRKTNTNWAAIS